MTTADLIQTMTDRIVQDFDPLRIILFGSHARGDARPESDIDLLVVFSQVANTRQAAIAIRRTLADLPVCKDIVVTTPEEIARRGDFIGTVLRPALREGKVLYECGLVERAGQGFDLICRECIRQSKPLPDFSHTDAYFVWLTLYGEIQDPEFLRFLEEIGQERIATFSTDDFLVVDLVHRAQPVPDFLKSRVEYLLDQGIIERLGRGRGVRLLLSQRFYRRLGKAGVYTRKRGLDRETNKALLLQHIQDSAETGTRLEELQQVLPGLSRDQVRTLLRELKRDCLIEVRGITKAARWFPSGQKRNSR